MKVLDIPLPNNLFIPYLNVFIPLLNNLFISFLNLFICLIEEHPLKEHRCKFKIETYVKALKIVRR